MWKSAYVGVYQLLNWKMHGETLKELGYFQSSNGTSLNTKMQNIVVKNK